MLHLSNNYWGRAKSQSIGKVLAILLADSSSYVRDNLPLCASVKSDELRLFSQDHHFLHVLRQFS